MYVTDKKRASGKKKLMTRLGDFTTSIEELMQGLNNLVVSGKVLYLGISDSPAWVVTKANQYARDHGLATFVYVN